MNLIHTAKLAVLALATLALPVAAAHADSIYVSSVSNSTDTFDLVLSGAPVAFNSGATITVTGLSNVSNVNYAPNISSYGTLSNTATSITLTLNNAYSYCGGSLQDLQLFTATTASTFPGNAIFDIKESTGDVRGTVSNTAVTPEPSSIALLGTGILSAAGILRRRRR